MYSILQYLVWLAAVSITSLAVVLAMPAVAQDVEAGAVPRLSANELLTGHLAWLDANHDGRIDASDHAYKAIRLWNDLNSDGHSVHARLDANGQVVRDEQGNPVFDTETQSLANAGIAGIAFGSGVQSAALNVGARYWLHSSANECPSLLAA